MPSRPLYYCTIVYHLASVSTPLCAIKETGHPTSEAGRVGVKMMMILIMINT